ncbi:hypothetical protein AHAS_Ahas10G0000200 [Arachis hypogaea]
MLNKLPCTTKSSIEFKIMLLISISQTLQEKHYSCSQIMQEDQQSLMFTLQHHQLLLIIVMER